MPTITFTDAAVCYSLSVPAGNNYRPALTTDISKNKDLSQLRVLMDQDNNVLTVLSDNQTVRLLKVTDITGKQVVVNINENQSQLDISGLENGVYILNIVDQNGDNVSRKFIKNRR